MDHTTDTVVVTGQKALENPIMVVEAVKRRTGKKAVLLSPSPEKLPPVKREDTKKQGAGAPDMKNDVAELNMVFTESIACCYLLLISCLAHYHSVFCL